MSRGATSVPQSVPDAGQYLCSLAGGLENSVSPGNASEFESQALCLEDVEGGVVLATEPPRHVAWTDSLPIACPWVVSLPGTRLSSCVLAAGGSPEAIFMLAPLLLLLSQDPLLLTGLEDRLRYFPPALALTAYLTVTAVAQVREA